jgi:hypothetical protein
VAIEGAPTDKLGVRVAARAPLAAPGFSAGRASTSWDYHNTVSAWEHARYVAFF